MNGERRMVVGIFRQSNTSGKNLHRAPELSGGNHCVSRIDVKIAGHTNVDLEIVRGVNGAYV